MTSITKFTRYGENTLQNLKLVDAFLLDNRKHNKCGMNVTMLQGLLFAVTSSLSKITLNDWVSVVFGGMPRFQSIKQQIDIYMALFELRATVADKLLLRETHNWYIWKNNKTIKLQNASDVEIVDFCSGYIKGYLLDPILRKNLSKDVDFILAFFIALTSLGSQNILQEGGKHFVQSNIQVTLKTTIPHTIINYYARWMVSRKTIFINNALKDRHSQE